MAEYDIPLATVADRSSWGYLPRQNAVVTGGDDFTITLTVYADEDATAPVTTMGAWAFLSVYNTPEQSSGFWNWWGSWRWDYGAGYSGFAPQNPLFQIENQGISNPDLGQFIFAFTPDLTANLSGRFAFVIEYEALGAGASIMRGIIEIRRGRVFPARPGFVLDDGSGNGSSLEGPDTLAP